MHSAAALAILVLSDLCLAIRVPIDWGHSDVQHDPQPQPSQVNRQPHKTIPTEYFVYTAEKPQFAVDIAAFHGVQTPGEHYKAYPVRPYTGKEKPEFGKHKILDEDREVFQPFQAFAKKNEALRNQVGGPLTVDYEVFHPYKAEEPALQEIYRDPVLAKIRNDIRDSEHKLQNYDKEAGKPDITPDEYLESPEQTDRKKIPHRNVHTQFELHRPQRRPVYNRPTPFHNNRDKILNHKFKHPWNQNYAKIRPVNYRPLKNYLGRLRQHHASKYDDGRNEYPQPSPPQVYSEPVDGYDIYRRGKDNYVKLRNNVDESINKAVQENRPSIFRKLELQNNGGRTETQISDSNDEENDNDDEDEFVPVKNYAQVRKTETTKYLPRDAAYNDAESFDEVRNAPRLREAIKSTKAQTVYTEEGYEDAAFDHAGEQKHASENEDHAGFLKEKEISTGKYKIPSFSGSYEDAKGNAYRDQNLHGKKWKNSDNDDEDQTDSEDYSEDEEGHSIEAEIYEDVTGERNKRENNSENKTESNIDINYKLDDIKNTKTKNNSDESSEVDYVETNSDHEMNKRETNFKVPEIDLNSTFWNEEEYKKLAKLKLVSKKDDIRNKYPYYFENLKTIHKDSPLRYSENLKLIPKKTNGGTEFYDSRSQFECPEVDDKVDALPEKLKKNGHPDEAGDGEEESKKKAEPGFDNIKENPRLKGLGDKIDCFKAKYFGENPLDSPFFKEELISNPEPVTAPNLATYKLKAKEPVIEESQFIHVFNMSDKLREDTKTDVFHLLDKLRNGQIELQESLVKTNENLRSSLGPPNRTAVISTQFPQPSNIYSDVFENIQNIILRSVPQESIISNKSNLSPTAPNNLTYNSYQNKEDITQSPKTVRRKRATPFTYEPYKIIRDGHVQDSKKTTTTSNISPLIRQLQSSRVVDRVTNLSQDKEQPVKRNVATRTYKDIGRKDRKVSNGKESEAEDEFVDINIDKRRGEPRYERKPLNHKSQYTPVENKKAMSLEDYQTQTNKTITAIQVHDDKNVTHAKKESNNQPHEQSNLRARERSPTVAPYYDVSQFLPKSEDLQKSAASNKVSKVIKVTTSVPDREIKRLSKNLKSAEVVGNNEDEKDYEEYDDEYESSTTTTTSPKPLFRRRNARVTTTTIKPKIEDVVEPELPKLRLTTRFRNIPNKKIQIKKEPTEKSTLNKYNEDLDTIAPKYREKQKKSTKSTLVTDTKTYNDGDVDGDEEDDLRKKEVDGLIGIRQDMDEYTPHYEKHIQGKKEKESSSSAEEDDEEYDDNDDDEFDDDDVEYDDEEIDDEEVEQEPATTTPEPTKRTLARTTEIPVSTTETRSAKLELKPLVTRKKIEIHKELPVNKSFPHITQFKQDIKEVEIIKEMPNKPSLRKPQKNLEALDLYKDDNLAKDINRLGGVEVFKQNLDLHTAPKHGGNYRSAKLIDLQEDGRPPLKPLHGGNLKVPKEDADASQSENTKLIELGDDIPARRMHGGNLKAISGVQRSRNTGRNARLEFADSAEKISSRGRKMHGGNFRLINDNERRRESSKNAKLIEFDDERDEEDESTSGMHGGNFKSYGNSRDDNHSFHGGNYRNAKIVQTAAPEKDGTIEKEKGETNTRDNAADLLNSFAQAVPMITTTPAFIRDPSKRKYYYVDS